MRERREGLHVAADPGLNIVVVVEENTAGWGRAASEATEVSAAALSETLSYGFSVTT